MNKPALLSIKARISLALVIASLALASLACEDGGGTISDTAIGSNPANTLYWDVMCIDPTSEIGRSAECVNR